MEQFDKNKRKILVNQRVIINTETVLNWSQSNKMGFGTILLIKFINLLKTGWIILLI